MFATLASIFALNAARPCAVFGSCGSPSCDVSSKSLRLFHCYSGLMTSLKPFLDPHCKVPALSSEHQAMILRRLAFDRKVPFCDGCQ